MHIAELHLQVEALEACKFRGHSMAPFEKVETAGRTIYRSTCNVCDKSVDVELKPPANGIQIGGEAVALDCDNDE